MKPNTIRAFTFSDLGEVSAAPYDVVVFGGGYAGFAAARRLRAATLDLGSSGMLLTFIPLLSPVLLTTAATGAVLLYRKLETPDC